jgi:uncharacterized membrane protein
MDNRTFGERVADNVASFGGSWYFILSFTAVLVVWIILNTLAFFNFLAWDEPPFILLNLVLSFIAAFQAPFIMMSQNRAAVKQDEVYRAFFIEIKELVERDISHTLDHHQSLKLIDALERKHNKKLSRIVDLLKQTHPEFRKLIEEHIPKD